MNLYFGTNINSIRGDIAFQRVLVRFATKRIWNLERIPGEFAFGGEQTLGANVDGGLLLKRSLVLIFDCLNRGHVR